MAKPTQDEELKKQIIQFIKDERCYVCYPCEQCEANNSDKCSAVSIMDSAIKLIEMRGYQSDLTPLMICSKAKDCEMDCEDKKPHNKDIFCSQYCTYND